MNRFLVAFAALAFGANAVAAPGWALIDLGTLGGFGSYGAAVSDSGFVVGCADLPGNVAHAFIWRNGIMRDLDAGSPGTGSSCALAVNNFGVAAGRTTTQEVVVWNGTSMTRLGTEGSASGINDAGVVVGTYKSGAATHGFMWANRALTDLGTFWPNAINNRDQVVGMASGGGILFEGGAMRALDGFTNAFGINDAGAIVGMGSNHGPIPVIYDGATRPLPGPSFSNAIAINGNGFVIGSGEGIYGYFINAGELQRLDTLPAVMDKGWRHLEPKGVNDHGWIVGQGVNGNGDIRAFLLIPGRPLVSRIMPVTPITTQSALDSNPAARW